MTRKPPPGANPPRAGLGTLGDLLRQKGFEASPEAPSPEAPAATFDLARSPKVVVRKERKGRGGHTATVVGNLALDEGGLDALARALRKALGCGSHVESGEVVLQGDVVDRAKAWLEAHGARRVVG